GGKKLQQPRGPRQAEATPTPQFLEARERFFPPRVHRAQLNALPLQRRNAASGQDVNRKVKRQRSGGKHIKRPQVDRSAGQIRPARRLRDDGALLRQRPGGFHAEFVSRRVGDRTLCRGPYHGVTSVITLLHRGARSLLLPFLPETKVKSLSTRAFRTMPLIFC